MDSSIRLLGESRGLDDGRLREEFLTKTQILLTAFVIGLEPLGPDLAASTPVGIGRGQIAGFDA